jgi:ATP-dependent DNA helicase RecG
MNYRELRAIVETGESERVEFKRSVAELDKGCRSLCGFLNGDGGLLLLDVSPKGIALGQQVAESTEQKVNAQLRKFEPVASVRRVLVPIPDQREQIIVLEATPSPELRPYTYDGRAYKRMSAETHVMSQGDYQQMLLERTYREVRWETKPVPRVDVALDSDEILRTARLGIESGRLPEATGRDVGDIVARFNLRRDGKLNHAAVALFGLDCFADFPQLVLRAARFQGVNKTSFIDNVQIQGHAFVILREAMTFLRRHLPVAGRIQPGLFEREDEPLFPLQALREALVNAICHRDYSLPGGAISLAIFDDRLEIWSDGTLPSGIRVGDLKRDHQSRPRNPVIASVLYKRGLVENWGRGTQRIVELCVLAGHPEPEYLEQSGALGVRFLPSSYIAPHRVAYTLTDRQRQIMQVLNEQRLLPLREVLKSLDYDGEAWRVRDDLQHLRRLGLVGLKGHGRAARWRLLRLPSD